MFYIIVISIVAVVLLVLLVFQSAHSQPTPRFRKVIEGRLFDTESSTFVISLPESAGNLSDLSDFSTRSRMPYDSTLFEKEYFDLYRSQKGAWFLVYHRHKTDQKSPILDWIIQEWSKEVAKKMIEKYGSTEVYEKHFGAPEKV